MPDVKIPDLTPYGSVVAAMKFEVDYLGTSYHVLASEILAYIGSGVTDGDKGDITVASGTWTIDAGVVTLAKMANLAANSIIGNNTGSSATPIALSTSQVKTLLALNNVENTALSTWAGSTSITTLGTVATGTWNATAIGVAKGGTGLTSSGTSNQVLGVNNAGSGLEYKTITAGSNVTVTHGANSITIASTGGGGGTPAGSDTQVQYNNASAFGATSNFIVDTGGTNTALVRATSPSNTKPALRLQSNGSGQTAAVFAVTDSSIDVCRIMRDGTINDATWGGNTIPTTKGGTGLTALGSSLQVLRTNSGASAMEWATISSGATGMFATTDTEKTASYTATANQLAPINLTSVSSDLTVTAPSTPSAGDWFGYYISGVNSVNQITLNRNGNTVNGGTTTTAFNLSARGDYAVWRYLSSTWVPVDFRQASVLFTPSSLSGLQLWLDASDSATLYDATSGGSLVAADGSVARWEDKSGNVRHATQSTSGNRPTRKTSVRNSRDVLRFDGSNDCLTIAGSASSMKFLHSANSTLFVVVKAGTTSDPGVLMGILGSNAVASANNGFCLFYDDRAPTLNDQMRWFVTRGTVGTFVCNETGSANEFAANTFSLISLVSTPGDGTASNRVFRYRNGTLLSQNNSNTDALSTADSTFDIQVGSTGNSGSVLNGDLCEVIIYNSALSTTDRQSVQNYLTAKWGL